METRSRNHHPCPESSSKIPDPLFVPSPVVARSFVPDPASPLTIQVHPKPPPLRISSPRLAASHPAPTSAPMLALPINPTTSRYIFLDK
ncbi:hypothetical protein H0H93_012747 [Arthromyces matolae]|nr:hypothetical protein H0H93_012747 [Arthromyces matolae]